MPSRATQQRRETSSSRPPRNAPRNSNRRPPAKSLQQRLGNQATQRLLARNDATPREQTRQASETRNQTALEPVRAEVDVTNATQSTSQQVDSSVAGSAATSTLPASPPTSADSVTAPEADSTSASTTQLEADQVAGEPTVEAQASVAPEPLTSIASTLTAIRQRAAVATQTTNSPETLVASAQTAALVPSVEQQRSSATLTVQTLNEAETSEVDRNAFKRALREAIAAATPEPQTETEAERVMQSGGRNASAMLSGELANQRDAVAGPMQAASTTEVPGVEQAQPAEATRESVGAPPVPVEAGPAVPNSLPPERLDYSSDRGPTEQLMADNNITEQQINDANDPAFGPTLTARESAVQNESTVRTRYRQGESQIQQGALANANQQIVGNRTQMHGIRESQVRQRCPQPTGDSRPRFAGTAKYHNHH